jgi:hypothetical protein
MDAVVQLFVCHCVSNRDDFLFYIVKKTVWTVCILLSIPGVSLAQSSGNFELNPPEFESSLKEESSSGHIKIIWKQAKGTMDGMDFQLQKSMDSSFQKGTMVYRGDDLATYVSGLANGNYFFRLRFVSEGSKIPLSSWSAPLQLTVKHHSMQSAFLLFILGAVVFLSTVVVLIKGLKDCEVA